MPVRRSVTKKPCISAEQHRRRPFIFQQDSIAHVGLYISAKQQRNNFTAGQHRSLRINTASQHRHTY